MEIFIMPMTITEKIIAYHAGVSHVEAGQIVDTSVDIVLANDITAPIAIQQFEKSGARCVFNPDRIALVPDHFVPNKDINSAMQVQTVREFAKKHNLTYFFELGEMGVEHALLPEQGIVGPGDLIIGADSHTCTYGGLGAFATGMGSTDIAAAMITGKTWLRVPETIKFVFHGQLNPWVEAKDLILYLIGDIGVDGALYKSIELTGNVIDDLNIAGRLTMANMAIEAGAKNGIIAPDDKTRDYIKGRFKRESVFYKSDPDATYFEVRDYDVSKIEPQVAFPHLPENTKAISEVGTVMIDQVVIGSCTNGRIEDLRTAASILKSHKIPGHIRLIIIPATPTIYKQALQEGLFEIFLESGGIISPPTCGPCLGGYMGILAKGEKAVATTNRNFVGRMGHVESEVYLASPAVAAASAIMGRISSPEEVMM